MVFYAARGKKFPGTYVPIYANTATVARFLPQTRLRFSIPYRDQMSINGDSNNYIGFDATDHQVVVF